MYNYRSLYSDLKKMKIDPNGTLLVHSSMKSIGEVEEGAETVLDVLCDYMKNGLLILPTHTWNTVNSDSPIYNTSITKSCVGILTNLFLKRAGVVRSLHPTHSVAALGKDADAFVAGEELVDTPCPKSGCWGRLYSRDATILFLGCQLNRNTYIHSVEEWHNVPDRINKKTFVLNSIDSSGKCHSINMHGHHCSFSNDISENYIKLETPFFYKKAIKYEKFGDANCIIGNAKKMADITGELLTKYDIDLFANKNPIPEEWYK